jgi:hypothetical protein
MKMPLKTIGIEFMKPAIPFDAASELMSYIAYPKNEKKRTRFSAALCRVEHLRQKDHQWRVTPTLVRPNVFAPDEKTFSRDLCLGLETLRVHLQAASLILHPHFESLKTGKRLPTIEGKAPTVDNITQIMARRESWNDAASQSTFESRVWTPVRPVAHLAFTFFNRVCGKRPSHGQKQNMLESLSPYPDEDTLREILRISELRRRLLPTFKLLRFVENQTIHFVESDVGSANARVST